MQAKSKSRAQAPAKVQVNIRIAREHLRILRRIAERKGTNPNAQIQIAVAEYIAKENA